MEVRELTETERAVAFREAIDQIGMAMNQIRVATHQLIDAELVGAVDVVKHALYVLNRAHEDLERQFGLFPATAEIPPARPVSPLTLSRTRRHREKGIDVVPGSVRRARLEAGLSLAKVADHQVSSVLIHLIEKDRTRPSWKTLELIARQTGKPLGYFLGAGQ